MSDLVRDWLQLHLAVGVGSITFHRMLSAFGDVRRVLTASIRELEGINGIGRVTAEQIFQSIREIDAAEELSAAKAVGAEVVPMFDSRYPAALKAINDPPPVLYVKGQLDDRDALSLSIVGSRRHSRYAWDQSHRFGYLLGEMGFTVVSGLARGIDGAAHRGALAAKGRTVAVLGCGLGHMYPAEHAELAAQIIETGGAVVSELPVDTPPNGSNFPPRNRIIAGWSLGTLIVEAPTRSGALITGRLAGEYNREVFALPGQIDRPGSGGSNAMIRDGAAKLVTSIEDILDDLGEVGRSLRSQDATKPSVSDDHQSESNVLEGLIGSFSEPERRIWNELESGAMDPDELCRATGLEIPAVNGALTGMQLKGFVKHLPGNQFARRQELS